MFLLYIVILAALALLGFLHSQGFLTTSARNAASRYFRAAIGPLLKRGWQVRRPCLPSQGVSTSD